MAAVLLVALGTSFTMETSGPAKLVVSSLLLVLTYPSGIIGALCSVPLIYLGIATPAEAYFIAAPVYAIAGMMQWFVLLPRWKAKVARIEASLDAQIACPPPFASSDSETPDISALLYFTNLLEIAHLLAPGGQVYEKQEELIADCRRAKKPFFSAMPLRHRVECPTCRMQQGEVRMHFEDPRFPIQISSVEVHSSTPSGTYVDIDRSVLHGILVHGNSMPHELQVLFANVRCQ